MPSLLSADAGNMVGVRAGARTGYVIPGRDGNGGLDPARNSSAVVAVAVAAIVVALSFL